MCWWGTSGVRRHWLGELSALGAIAAIVVLAGAASAWVCGRWPGQDSARARPGRGLVWLAVVVLVSSLIGSGLWLRRTHLEGSAVASLAADGAVVTVDLRLDSDPRRVTGLRFGTLVMAPATTMSVSGRGRVGTERVPISVSATGERAAQLIELPSGARLRLTGRLKQSDLGDRDAARLTVLSVIEVLSAPSAGQRLVNSLRHGLVASTRTSPSAQAGLLPSLVVGDTSRLSDQVKQDFTATGLTHLTAVSGANLVLILGFVALVAGLCGITGWWFRGVQLLTVFGFVVLCRSEPSVLRAAAMGLVALASLGRAAGTGRGLRQLCLAVLGLMVWDPWLARSWGFALSVSATAGLVLCAGRWQRGMSWLPAWLAEAFCVPLAAQLATAPLVCALAGTVSLSGLVANLAAGPFVGPATVLGLMAALSSPIPGPLSLWLGWLGGWCTEPLIRVAALGADLPGGQRPWPGTLVGVGLLGVLCLVLMGLLPRLLARSWATVGVCLLLMVGLLRAPQLPGWPGDWQVVFCGVGQGDATVLRAGPGTAVVVDTGPDPDALKRCLVGLGVNQVPLVVLTHYHEDHIAGLELVTSRYHPRMVVVNGFRSPPASASRVDWLISRAGATRELAVAEAAYQVGQVTVRVVGAGVAAPGAASQTTSAEAGSESAVENDSSIIVVGTVGELDVLLPGDVEPAGQQQVVRRSAMPRVEVLKMPHHGSSRQDREFWRQSGAVLAIASAGANNSYGHPAAAALRLATDLGMQIARTDQQGSIAIWLNQGSVQMAFAGPSP